MGVGNSGGFIKVTVNGALCDGGGAYYYGTFGGFKKPCFFARLFVFYSVVIVNVPL